MKSLKRYLLIVSILLISALLAGIYVWYMYQKIGISEEKNIIVSTLQSNAV